MSLPAEHFESTFFRLELREGIAVLHVSRSSLSEEDNVELFGLDLSRLVDQMGYRQVVLSLEGVRWISSSILGKLIHLHRHLKRQQGEMALCHVGCHLGEILSTSRLDTYFTITPTAEVAVSQWQTK